MRLGLMKTGEGDHLLIVIHHLVVDGVSWRILFEDVQTGYEQAERGEDPLSGEDGRVPDVVGGTGALCGQ